MRIVTLGRTGLKVSAAGLGTGGRSAIGLKEFGQDHAASIVRAAYDEGVNFFDTASKYGTEGAVGQGLAGLDRGSYVLSTKFAFIDKDGSYNKRAADLTSSLEDSLRALRTDYVDIFQLQGIPKGMYVEACGEFLYAMLAAKEQGKIRFMGVSEDFPYDLDHRMLEEAVSHDLFDVMMLGYNILNQSAAKTLLPGAEKHRTGTLCMYAVRSALANPEKLRACIGTIIASGQADPELLKADGDLAFLVESGAAASIPEAAYRFCAHAPGLHVILTGTGNIRHLKDNIKAINAPPLPGDALARLYEMFGNVDCVSGG